MDQSTEVLALIASGLATLAGMLGAGAGHVAGKRSAAKQVEGVEVGDRVERTRMEVEHTAMAKDIDFLKTDVRDRDHQIRNQLGADIGKQATSIAKLEVRLERSEADIKDIDNKTALEVKRLEGIIERALREINRKLDGLIRGTAASARSRTRSTDDEEEDQA